MTEQTSQNGEKRLYYSNVLDAAENADRVMREEKCDAVDIRLLDDGRGELTLKCVEEA